MDNLLLNIPEEFRNKYKGKIPFPVISLAKDLGLKIYETDDFEENEAGSIKKEGNGYVIYINATDPSTRKRFTVAHEVGHFLLHKKDLDDNHEFVDGIKQPVLNRTTRTDLPEDEKKKEIQANDFAAQLLMPEEDFKNAFNKAENIEDVASQFLVSPSAATIRAKKVLGLYII